MATANNTCVPPLIRNAQALAKLSRREFEVFEALAAGQTVTEIAASLSMSVKTVSTYRQRALEKLELFSTDPAAETAAIAEFAAQNPGTMAAERLRHRRTRARCAGGVR